MGWGLGLLGSISDSMGAKDWWCYSVGKRPFSLHPLWSLRRVHLLYIYLAAGGRGAELLGNEREIFFHSPETLGLAFQHVTQVLAACGQPRCHGMAHNSRGVIHAVLSKFRLRSLDSGAPHFPLEFQPHAGFFSLHSLT